MTDQAYVLLVGHSPQDVGLPPCSPGEPFGDMAGGIHAVPTAEAALRALDGDPGCIGVLLCIDPSDSPGLQTLATLAAHGADIPVVALIDRDDAQLGLSAVLAGAQDYLVKGRLDAALLRRSLHYAAQRKRVESALVERSLHDALTGLPRRRLLLDRLGVAMRRCARDGSSGTLLFIDLDQFKQINQLHGRAVGDAALRLIGQRLTALVRDSDTVARFGGDEFVVLLPNESRVLEALAVGEKLIEALGRTLDIDGRELAISASIGVARFRDATEPPELVVQRADQAMCAARKDGREGRSRVRML